MKRLAHNNRRDANEPDIVDALESIGCDVMRLDEFDLLCGYRGRDFKIEVKTETGKPTPAQIKLGANWRGSPLYYARTIDEAIAVVTQR